MKKKKFSLLIFGISSTLGKYFLKKYTKDYKICGTYYKNKSKINLNKRLIQANLVKKIRISKKFDFVIHAASLRPEKFFNHKKLYTNNLKITKNIVNFSIKNNIKRYVFLSSIAVYEKNKKGRISENTVKQKKNKYGLSKLNSEIYIKKMCNKYNISYLILRLPAILANNSEFNFYSEINKKLKKNKKIEIFNGEKKFNNFIHVKYISKIIKIYFSKKTNKNYILNLASTKPMRLKEIVSKLKSNISYQHKIKFTKKKQNNIIINCTKAIKNGFPLPTVKQSLNTYNLDN